MIAHNAVTQTQQAVALDRLIRILAERAADEWLTNKGQLHANTNKVRHDTSRNLRTI